MSRDLRSVLKTAKYGEQSALAEAIGVSRQSISRWARGLTVPNAERLPEIEAFFGLEPGTIRIDAPPSNAELDQRVKDLEAGQAELKAALAPGRSERIAGEIFMPGGYQNLSPAQKSEVDALIVRLLGDGE